MARISGGEARRRRSRAPAPKRASYRRRPDGGRGDAELAHRLEAAGPYGSGNPEPVFVLPRHRLTDVMAVGADHLRVRAVAGDGQSIEAIAFRAAGKALGEALTRLRGSPVHLAGTLASTAMAAASGRN